MDDTSSSSGARETSFISDEAFTQETFRRWLGERPRSDPHRYELIGGYVVMSPPRSAWHQRVEARLVSLLEAHVSAGGLGHVFGSRAGYELPGGDTVLPDVSFLPRERCAAGPSAGQEAIARIVPSLVVEVPSPATVRRVRSEKLEIYARSGVDECWIVDTTRREITVHPRSEEGFAESVIHVSGVIESRVLPGLEVRVEDVFAAGG